MRAFLLSIINDTLSQIVLNSINIVLILLYILEITYQILRKKAFLTDNSVIEKTMSIATAITIPLVRNNFYNGLLLLISFCFNCFIKIAIIKTEEKELKTFSLITKLILLIISISIIILYLIFVC